MHASLQRKFSFSYIAIILAVLILLNTYPLITSENLTFRSKQSSLQGSVSVMVTALSGLEELSEENVAGAMTLVEETGISRVLVTDASGRVLYDTRETDGAIGRYAFYTELVQALRGEDVFYTEFSDKAFKSRAASPVIYHSQTIGAVYAYEYDTEQAELLLSLQRNLLTISAVVLVFAGGISVLLSRVLTRRFGVLTDAIRKMREGSYSHRAEVGGHDEISELAAEFNDMADRLQTTEDARRRFVSDASHELKTPLAGIRLLSDSILQTENMDAQTVREFVGDIEQESERLARITENLLRLTRLDSGMLPEAQRVDLSSVMARVVRMLRLVAEEKQVDLSYEIRREGQTLASEDEIHEIIYNLTENAIKYNRPGGFVKLLLVELVRDILPILIGGLLMGIKGQAAVGRAFAGFCLVMGRLYPVFYDLKGSHAIICMLVVMAFVNFSGALAVLLFVALGIWLTKYVSLGAVAGAAVMCIASLLLVDDPLVMKLALFAGLAVLVRHIPAVSRMLSGRETKLSFEEARRQSGRYRQRQLLPFSYKLDNKF